MISISNLIPNCLTRTMKIFFRCSLSAAFGLSIACRSSLVKAQETNVSTSSGFSLSILHMNDHHSHLPEEDFTVAIDTLPSDVTANINTTAVQEIDVSYGGFPRLISLFRQLETENPNTLKLHAGDVFAGTLFFTLFEGYADAELMNHICFDAMTLGNHEFDNGNEALTQFITDLQGNTTLLCEEPTPIVSANIADDGDLQPLLLPYVIREFEEGTQTVAVIGITTDTTSLTSSPSEGTTFLDERETAINTIAEVTSLGVDKIILLTHIGFENDVESMAQIEDVDVVVGGHSHTLMADDSAVSRSLRSADAPYPEVITRTSDGGTVCVVQTWEYGHGLGVLNIDFDEAGNVLSCDGGPQFPFDSSPSAFAPELDEETATALTTYLESLGVFVAVEADPNATEALAGFQAQVDDFGLEVIATVPEPICYERIPGQGRSEFCTAEETSSQGGPACDLVAQAFLDQALSADVAIQNAGGCRTDIGPGDYTIGDAFVLLPFSNTLVTLEMTGAQIITVLNEAAMTAIDGTSSGAYPYAAGLRYDVDANAGFPNYISNVEINLRLEGEWVPIDETVTYTVVTNDFISAGRDGYNEFSSVEEGLIENLYLEYALSFINYAEKVGTLVAPPLDNRSTKSFIALGEATTETGTDEPNTPSTPTETETAVNGDDTDGESSVNSDQSDEETSVNGDNDQTSANGGEDYPEEETSAPNESGSVQITYAASLVVFGFVLSVVALL